MRLEEAGVMRIQDDHARLERADGDLPYSHGLCRGALDQLYALRQKLIHRRIRPQTHGQPYVVMHFDIMYLMKRRELGILRFMIGAHQDAHIGPHYAVYHVGRGKGRKGEYIIEMGEPIRVSMADLHFILRHTASSLLPLRQIR